MPLTLQWSHASSNYMYIVVLPKWRFLSTCFLSADWKNCRFQQHGGVIAWSAASKCTNLLPALCTPPGVPLSAGQELVFRTSCVENPCIWMRAVAGFVVLWVFFREFELKFKAVIVTRWTLTLRLYGHFIPVAKMDKHLWHMILGLSNTESFLFCFDNMFRIYAFLG